MDEPGGKTKAHRTPHSGTKFRKKQAKAQKTENAQDKAGRASQGGRNVKAFAVQHVTKTARMVRRTLDHQTKRYHIPSVDRSSELPPPMVVALVGPPGSGKSTLLRSLVKHMCKQKVGRVDGPVTLVASKKKRVTLLECNNDINCMIDVAKIADLVLLLVDASRGFEMPTFEFSNILHVHGMPRVLGVLTHLDHYRDNKALKKKKKQMKHRLWNDIGAKFFYLTRFQNKSGDYLPNEVRNLARFISVKNARDSEWRSSHPFILVDRVEDITNPRLLTADPKADRLVSFYGYVRGTHLANCSAVHLPGVGDFTIRDMRMLEDPCPLPVTDKNAKAAASGKRRTLSEKERGVYAPMAGIGGVLFDGDATYIDAGGSHHHKPEVKITYKEAQKRKLEAAVEDFDDKLETEHTIRILGDAPMVRANECNEGTRASEEESDAEDDEADDDSLSEMDLDDMESVEWSASEDDEDVVNESPKKKRLKLDGEKPVLEPSVEVPASKEIRDAFEELAVEWKPVETEKINWNSLVYGIDDSVNPPENQSSDPLFEIGGIFRAVGSEQQRAVDGFDVSLPETETVRDWSLEEIQNEIRDLFTTGQWSESEDAECLLAADAKHKQDISMTTEGKDSSDDDSKSDQEDPEDSENAPKKIDKARVVSNKREKLERKKAEHKALFDSVYDSARGGHESTAFYENWKSKMDEQGRVNRQELEHLDVDTRLQLEGYRPGLYVRVELEGVPCELINHLQPSYPMILGGLLKSEEAMGLVHARFLHHRWYKKILKSGDPLVISAGWRRFQSLPIYSRQEDNLRRSFLKYTPEHSHCYITFYGPLVPNKSGILALQAVNADYQSNFRIAGSASVLDTNSSFRIEKKLKLRGEPFKIFSKTAFIKGMFNSPLEVSKFINAQIRTVSGVRGRIKQSLVGAGNPVGSFRAGFEAPIVASDLVFCRCFTPVKIVEFFAPVTNLLLVKEERGTWRGVRTVGQIRRETGQAAPNNPDSHYKPIERPAFVSLPVKVANKLQKQLPYRLKPGVATIDTTVATSVKVVKGPRQPQTLDRVSAARPRVIREARETRRDQLVERLRSLQTAREAKRKASGREKSVKYQAQQAKINAEKEKKAKALRKKKLALAGSRGGAPGKSGGRGRSNPDRGEGVASSKS